MTIINSEFKQELQKYTDVPIKEVEVQAVYDGSIEIIFTATLKFLEIVGGLKDLYDVVKMITKISERHMRKKLNDEFGNYFRVGTYVIVPNTRYHYEPGCLDTSGRVEEYSYRNGFFYYLLAINIVLILIIVLLVFSAVKIVYF